MVLFAGIAAEALIYEEAEGGENDENLFRSICVLLDPPLSVAQVLLQKTYLLVLISCKLLSHYSKLCRCQIKQGGQCCNLIICSSGTKRLIEQLSKL